MTLGETSALDLAVRRLERAVAQLEQRLAARASRAAAVVAVAPIDSEAARLKAELDAARERERALEDAGAQASIALGRAIAEIRAALGDEGRVAGPVNDDHPDAEIEPGFVTRRETDELFDEPEEASSWPN